MAAVVLAIEAAEVVLATEVDEVEVALAAVEVVDEVSLNMRALYISGY